MSSQRVRRRMNPRTKKDFDALYSELRNWREHQESQIEQSDMTPPERRSAMMRFVTAPEAAALVCGAASCAAD